MVVEFEAGCSTAQTEDCLRLYLPSRDQGEETYMPVPGTYSTTRWPEHSLVLPGNEVSAVYSKSSGVDNQMFCFAFDSEYPLPLEILQNA